MTVVGIVSPGAMGSAVGRALAQGGVRVVATVAGRSPRTAALAHGLDLVPSLDDLVAAADVVLSIVPPGEARSVAKAIADAALRSGARPLVAELNATAPQTVREIAAELAAAEIDLVDGSISGSPPMAGRTTDVYLSGPRATEVAAFRGQGLRLTVVGTEIGAASAVKMSTASVHKGRLALVVQALRAAQANGVLEPVLADLRRSDPEGVDRFSALVQRGASVSGRYVGEMHEIASSQDAAGLGSGLFEAFAAVYAEIAGTPLAELEPESVEPAAALVDVLDRLHPSP